MRTGSVGSLADVDQRRLRRGQRLARGRQREFTPLAHPHLGGRDRALGLHDFALQFAVAEPNELLALGDLFAFLDQDFGDRSGDLASDVGSIMRQHICGRHHGLDDHATRHAIDDDGRTNEGPQYLPEAERAGDCDREREPPVSATLSRGRATPRPAFCRKTTSLTSGASARRRGPSSLSRRLLLWVKAIVPAAPSRFKKR
jgi:hypothetical protein